MKSLLNTSLALFLTLVSLQTTNAFQEGAVVPQAIVQQPQVTPTAQVVQPYVVQQPVVQQPIVQQPVAQTQIPTARAAIVQPFPNPNTQIVNEVRGIIARQAQLGQFPTNNQALAALQQFVNQYGGVAVPQPPQVSITNNGPGWVLIGQSQYLQPNGTTLVTLNVPQVSIMAYNSQTNIVMRHAGNGISKFWDVDDNRYSFLRPTDPSPLLINLGQNVQGYRLEPQ